MVGKDVVITLGLSVTHAAFLVLQGMVLVGAMPCAGATESVGLQAAGTSSGSRVLLETFDDNARGAIWKLLEEDPGNCILKETNRRLELQATAQSVDAAAGYVSAGWRLDARRDFSLKADYYYDLMSYTRGWVSLGVVADADSPWENNAVVGVGCTDGLAHYWYRKQVGLAVNTSLVQRFRNSGTLYVSYNAEADELYLGFSGYGAGNAWEILPGLLGGQWAGRPVYIWLAGGSDGLAVTSGHVYLDNLVVDTGFAIEASLKDVYRFWSPSLDRHFYTISEEEKETLCTQFRDVWTYEGVVYHAYEDDSDPDTKPVYRFWSDRLQSHFYTLDEAEKDWLIGSYSHLWTFEGVAFYAYPEGSQPPWARPVYRLWSDAKSTHFYTMSETEKEDLLSIYPNVWSDEGIVWYAIE